ncbi:right-handed parallel beta-helix repeat-containing protein [Poseidonocella sp. HB161398]|uniref:right-handed parallel beta-helix repeat-containing protein n=1 Tax=Poseidonocella sp. HB161398 TaxID=2320855 RepID=UPI001487071E|nr:right-handed parallel beta-helix repeat-containing protein [Poseidonocella sp. HB161398]
MDTFTIATVSSRSRAQDASRRASPGRPAQRLAGPGLYCNPKINPAAWLAAISPAPRRRQRRRGAALILAVAAFAIAILALPERASAQDSASGSGRVLSTRELGWKAGSDVGEKLAALLANDLQPGDTLRVEKIYRIDASELQLLPGMTVEGVNGGGFDVVSRPGDKTALFIAADGLTVSNLVIRSSTAPQTDYLGTKAQPGEHYYPKRIFILFGHERVSFVNSEFQGNVDMFIDARNSPDMTVENSFFEGANYQISLEGRSDGATITGSHFRYAVGDAIRTATDGGYGPGGISVSSCFFEDANRDGIEATGGFRDGRITDSVFFANGIDLKVSLEDAAEDSRKAGIDGTRIDGVQVIDESNAIVISVLDRHDILTAGNAEALMPHDIRVANSIIESTTGDEMRAFLIRDGYDIHWENMTFLGNIKELRVLNEEAPEGWTAHGVDGAGLVTGTPRCSSTEDRRRRPGARPQVPYVLPDPEACPLRR